MNRVFEHMLTGRVAAGVKRNGDGGRRMLTGVFAATAILGGLVGSYPVSAATVTWTGAGDGTSWNDDGNWDGPRADADLVIDNGDTVTVDQLSLYVGDPDGKPDSLTMSSGSDLNVTASGTIDGGGSLSLTGAGTAVSLQTDITVGKESGVSSLELQSGATLATGGDFVSSDIGADAGATGRVTITGAGSRWTVGSSLKVGSWGTGILLIENGGAVTTNGSYNTLLGARSSGTATVTGAGSTWDTGDRLSVGSFGSGTLYIENGGQVTGDDVFVGYYAGSTGSVTVGDAGSLLDIQNELYVGLTGNGTLIIENGAGVSSKEGIIGQQSSGSGSVIVTGAGSRWDITAGGFDSLIIGDFGTGSLTLSDGGVVDLNSGSVVVMDSVNASGVINIGAEAGSAAAAPGSLYANEVLLGDSSGRLVFNHTAGSYDFDPIIIGSGEVELHAGTTRFSSGSVEVNNVKAVGGTLRVDDGETLNIKGDYTQSATASFRTGVSSAASYGRLQVDGTATFADGAAIEVDVATINTLAHNETLSGVISAGTLNASTFSLTDNSALFDFSASISGDAVDLRVIDSTASGVYDSVLDSGFTPGFGAAEVLDGFVSGGATGTDMDNVVAALGLLGTEQAVSDAVGQTLPNGVHGLSRIPLTLQRRIDRVIQGRQLTGQGMSSGDGFFAEDNLWVMPLYSQVRQDPRNGAGGYDADTRGVVAGIEGRLANGGQLGVALAYGDTRVDGRNIAAGNDSEIDSYYVTLYGSRSLSRPGMLFDWQADLGLNQNESRRYMAFINRTAVADYDSHTAHLGMGLEQLFTWNEQTRWLPGVRLDYTWLRQQSYSESGAGALNLQVAEEQSDALVLTLQGRVEHQMNPKARLLANIGLGYDLMNERSLINASYSGGGAAFVSEGLDPSPWLFQGGVGLAWQTGDQAQLAIRYDLEGREDFLSQTASLRFDWHF